MDCEQQRDIWLEQLCVLTRTLNGLSETPPTNILKHFFLQVVEKEFATELESTKTVAKRIVCLALDSVETLEGSTRRRAAAILKRCIQEPVLTHIKLADIRNIAVFEIYRHCGVTLDTYFERYPSPPGRPEAVTLYSQMAHGGAGASAEKTAHLTSILLYMQVLKRFFLITDHVLKAGQVSMDSSNLNWIPAMWYGKVKKDSLGELIWELFLDVYEYEL